MLRRSFIALATITLLSASAFADDKPGEWKELFDGKTFDGWKLNENKESWSIEDGKHIVIKVNDTTTVDYTEPDGKEAFSEDFERRIGEGTFALQAHDPKSKVYFRNLKVRRLP